jgi:hypothetical protein
MTQSHGSKITKLFFRDQDRQTAEEQIFSQGWPNAGSSLFDSGYGTVISVEMNASVSFVNKLQQFFWYKSRLHAILCCIQKEILCLHGSWLWMTLS